jgi:hypothetical protein
MRRGKLSMGMALTAGALVAGTVALAPGAAAVTPTTATATFSCGIWGSGPTTLTATQSGTSATITVTTSAITAPIAVSANSIKSTLTLTKNGSGTSTFTGSSNPAIPAGGAVSTGPLTGTVASGDSLVAKSLTVVVFGVTVTCSATTTQSPGPFVF